MYSDILKYKRALKALHTQERWKQASTPESDVNLSRSNMLLILYKCTMYMNSINISRTQVLITRRGIMLTMTKLVGTKATICVCTLSRSSHLMQKKRSGVIREKNKKKRNLCADIEAALHITLMNATLQQH